MALRREYASRLFGSPYRIWTSVLLLVFAVEVAVMFALPYVVPNRWGEAPRALLDALLLTCISAPVLWWVIIGPLRRVALEERARSETIVASAGEGIVTIDGNNCVLSCNPVAASLFRSRPEAMLEHPLHDYVPIAQTAGWSKVSAQRCQGRREDGTLFPLHVGCNAVPTAGEPTWVVVLRDLTESDRVEKERIDAARHAEALRAQQMTTLAQLATGVAHEIRNPLTSIKMLVQVNHEKLAQMLTTSKQVSSDLQVPSAARGGQLRPRPEIDLQLPLRDLQMVEKEIRRMERSVNALLDYARPEPMEPRLVTLSPLIERVCQLIQGRAQAGRVSISLHTAGEVPDIEADPAQLQQLFLNLALNACDAMPHGGRLAFRLARLGDQLRVQVSDTGVGIAREVIDQLFSPFVTTKPNGVGLGLGICRRIAESHRGELLGYNLPEGGACFELRLPVPASRAPDLSPPSSAE